MVTDGASDSAFMSQALQLAERGRGRTWPNPMVGAVVVSAQGEILGEGYHERAGGAHAEVRALDAAGARARGATLYCTLEPCCHMGRTGPCTERIVAAGIARVVAAVEDPNPEVRGGGFAYLRAHGLRVDVGEAAGDAARQNRPFFTFMRARRPFVIMKVAVSRDGRVAAAPGTRTPLTSWASARHAHRVRAEIGAIGIGSNTALVDDPQLTVREVERTQPVTRVIFDRRLRLPTTARVLSTREQGPVIIVTGPDAVASRAAHAKALADAGATLTVVETPTLTAALQRLAEIPMVAVILEGGPTMHAAAWAEGVVDCVHHYAAPITLGGGGVPWLQEPILTGLESRRIERLGPDTFTEGYVHRVD